MTSISIPLICYLSDSFSTNMRTISVFDLHPSGSFSMTNIRDLWYNCQIHLVWHPSTSIYILYTYYFENINTPLLHALVSYSITTIRTLLVSPLSGFYQPKITNCPISMTSNAICLLWQYKDFMTLTQGAMYISQNSLNLLLP